MMDSVNIEMKSIHETILKNIWHPIFFTMEDEPMKNIFTKSPECNTYREHLNRIRETTETIEDAV